MAELHPPAPGTSYAVAAGSLVLTGGQVPRRTDGSVPETLEEQIDLVLDNLESVLTRTGAGLADVVHLRAYVINRDVLTAWVERRRSRLGAAKPAATTVIVDGLAEPRWQLEVEAIARTGART
jgi:enamine deaminase RidA (YjgF/YER057c/UK114 family)